MQHFTMDGFEGYRSRLDDLRLVHELMEELPDKLGMHPVMPPFLLPYYNGVHPDDCGISAFLFLAGGHLTLHTFSVAECYFVDLVYPGRIDGGAAIQCFNESLPARAIETHVIDRFGRSLKDEPYNPDDDFGPHLFLDIEGYQGAQDMNQLFELFEGLPTRLGMTPIMRPYIISGETPQGEPVVSSMTMIAESHIALHVFPESKRACFDIFSCRPFDREAVMRELLAVLKGEDVHTSLIARGHRFASRRTRREDDATRSNRWLRVVRGEDL